MPKALLINPEFPPSYWSGKYALEFIGRKSANPPLSLLTLAALFPPHFELKVVDLNVEPLKNQDLAWADYAFITGMIVQRESMREVISRCKAAFLPVIVGGPYATSFPEDFAGVDHFVLGEVEDFFLDFLCDLEAGRAGKLYEPARDARGNYIKPDISRVPPPRYDLLDVFQYGSMSLQFSRGCPFDCEFCDITKLYGRVPRTKGNSQMLAELNVLYQTGWRGAVFLVDDNFIGNRKRARELLPDITAWQKQHGYPFRLYTEASINLAEMPELMDLMVQAGFDMVFLGLETPNSEALLKANKGQNVKKGGADYLLRAVRTIQAHGLEVTGGFILGLDGDGEDAFDAQINFVQQAGIPTAMVGLLTPVKGTALYERYQREGRLIDTCHSGNNVSCTLTYVPEMDPQTLVSGYKRVLGTLYDPGLRSYFERCLTLFKHWRLRPHCQRQIGKDEIRALFRSLGRQIFSRQGPAYLKFLGQVLLRFPSMLPEAVRMGIMGYHYQRVTSQQVLVDDFCCLLEVELERVKKMIARFKESRAQRLSVVQRDIQRVFADIQRRYEEINHDFRAAVRDAVHSFRTSVRAQIEQFSLALQVDVPTFE